MHLHLVLSSLSSLWLTFLPQISSWPAVVLPCTADPKKTPTTKRPSNFMFILPWWIQPAQSDFHWLALNWNCIHLNHPSHPRQPAETEAALIARISPGSAPSPMHLAFLIGKELLCLHWHWLQKAGPLALQPPRLKLPDGGNPDCLVPESSLSGAAGKSWVTELRTIHHVMFSLIF